MKWTGCCPITVGWKEDGKVTELETIQPGEEIPAQFIDHFPKEGHVPKHWPTRVIFEKPKPGKKVKGNA